MTTADARLQRLLLAFPLMADEPRLSLAELAARIGTDGKTLANDFACLDRDDTPAGFVDAIQVYVSENKVSMRSAHFKRPMRLTRPEVAALELGLGMLQQELPADEQQVVKRVRARLSETAIRTVDTVHERRQGGAIGTVDEELSVELARETEMTTVAVLQRCVETETVVEMVYQRPDQAQASTRRIHPYAMVRADANIYMVGYCEQNATVRVFRLDRVVSAAYTTDTFARPADFSVESVLRRGHVFVQETPAPDTLVVRYSAAVARWIAERETGVLQPDGAFIVAYPLADEAWAVRHVLQYGPDAVMVAPERVRTQLQLVLQRLLARLA